jgi:hypothetical protein
MCSATSASQQNRLSFAAGALNTSPALQCQLSPPRLFPETERQGFSVESPSSRY